MLFRQFPTFNFGLAHYGSRPFNYRILKKAHTHMKEIRADKIGAKRNVPARGVINCIQAKGILMGASYIWQLGVNLNLK